AVRDASEVRVAARREGDEGGSRVQLGPGHALDHQLVAAELLGDGNDIEVVRHPEVVEARPPVLAKALVAAEPGCKGLLQGVTLAEELAVELLALLEIARRCGGALAAFAGRP